MEINISKKEAVTVVQPLGRLDATTTSSLQEELDRLIAGGEVKLLINLAELDYISSAGLRCVLSSAKKAQNRKGELRLANLGGMVKEVFQMAGFYEILPIYDTEEEARQDF